MNIPNLYWPVYRSIETDVIDLTYNVCFCDEQIDTYSIRIADLFFRCCVEIESISKDLFNSHFIANSKYKIGKGNNLECEFGNDGEWRRTTKSGGVCIQYLYFDDNCIKFLNEKWSLDRKQVILKCNNMFFKIDDNRILFPLSKTELEDEYSPKTEKQKMVRGGWQKSYQALKHSRSKNQSRGSIFYLLRALAALYLLNVYNRYIDKLATTQKGITHIPINTLPLPSTGTISMLGQGMYDTSMLDLSFGSEIFSLSCVDTHGGIDNMNILHYTNYPNSEIHVVVPIFTEQEFSNKQKEDIVKIAIKGIRKNKMIFNS